MFGLPLHPLVVHAAVVFIPLAALGALLVVFVPGVRARYAGLAVLVGLVAAASGFAALLTGPMLAADLGLSGGGRIARHQALGTWTPWVTALLAASLPLHLWARRRAGGASGAQRARTGGAASGAGAKLTGAVAAAAALGALVMVALTGEAGATAVWGR